MQIAKGAAYLVKKRETVAKMDRKVPLLERYLTGEKETLSIRYVQQGEEEAHTEVEGTRRCFPGIVRWMPVWRIPLSARIGMTSDFF